jgi:hypothetical protein
MKNLIISVLTKYFASDQVSKNEMGGTCARMRRRRGAYRILAGKPKGKRPLGRLRRRLEDNIKMDFQDL